MEDQLYANPAGLANDSQLFSDIATGAESIPRWVDSELAPLNDGWGDDAAGQAFRKQITDSTGALAALLFGARDFFESSGGHLRDAATAFRQSDEMTGELARRLIR